MNFSRIAILDARVVNKWDANHLQNKIINWAEHAKYKGADSCYIRHISLEKDLKDFLIETMFDQFDFIQSYHDYEISKRTKAIHFKEYDQLPQKKHGKIIGKSCHSLESAINAQNNGADYVFFSPIFNTNTHSDAVPVGTEKLRDFCDVLDIPVIALGGINEDNYQQCIEAGAFGFAAIDMYSLK